MTASSGYQLAVMNCGADEVNEALVDAAVGGEFGVEGGGHDVALFDEDGEAVAFGEDFDAVAGFHDTWGANVNHLERAAGELRVAGCLLYTSRCV